MPTTSTLAAEVFVVVIASIAIGVIGVLLLTTHEIRRTIKARHPRPLWLANGRQRRFDGQPNRRIPIAG